MARYVLPATHATMVRTFLDPSTGASPLASPPRRPLSFAALCASLALAACGSRTALNVSSDVTGIGDASVHNLVDASAPGPTCDVVRARVFLTSTMHDADFGGVSGADAECTARAAANRLGGAWRAWLSDTGTPASAHIYAAPGGYALLDGTLVASSFEALVSGSLAHAIDQTELGLPISDGNTEVWTGTDLQSPAPTGYCPGASGSDWSSNDRGAPYAFVGHSNASDATWTAVYLQFCNRTNVRLYCFEVCDRAN